MTWEYFWSYYKRSDNTIREKMVFQILHEDWLFTQPESVQVEVLKFAPEEFVKEHRTKLKPSVINDLKPKELIDWSKL